MKGVINIKQDNIHYNIDNIDSKNALFNLILGEKSGGKSYQVKHKKAVEHYYFNTSHVNVNHYCEEQQPCELTFQYISC